MREMPFHFVHPHVLNQIISELNMNNPVMDFMMHLKVIFEVGSCFLGFDHGS
jgi:hypothetical protein